MNGSGVVYVADRFNDTIRRLVVATGQVTTLAGLAGNSGDVDGISSAARFYNPRGVAADGLGNVYVADSFNYTIRKVVVATGQVTTLAGLAGSYGSADGIGSAARFANPTGVAADGMGNVYVADSYSHTIRQVVVATGQVTTLAGLAGSSGSADGTGGAARFYYPRGVAADGAGSVYVADSFNHTMRKVAVSTGQVTTLAGLAGNAGSVDGIGSAARFRDPYGVASDGMGNLYVADESNHTIRKIVVATGQVTTLAGLAGSGASADGIGSAARFNSPAGVSVDGSGIGFVADSGNHAIRKVVVATGEVTTLGGLAPSPGSADGTGSWARFDTPSGVAVGFSGEIFVGDSSNHAIRVGRAALPDLATIDSAVGAIGQPRQLDTSPQTATAWHWTLERIPTGSSAALSSDSIRNPVFNPDVAGYYVFGLTASKGLEVSITTVALNAVAPPTATVSGGGTICLGGVGVAIQATLTGVAPWSVTWSDGVIQGGVASSPATRVVSPASTTVYTVTSVSNAGGPGTATGSATVTVLGVPAAAITALGSTAPGAMGLTASVPDAGTGAVYAWTAVNGTITSGTGTRQISWTAGSPGYAILDVTVSAGGCTSSGSKGVRVGTDPVPPTTFDYLAGNVGGAGVVDGAGSAARFRDPWGIAADGAGSVYLADTGNHTIRRVLTSTGQVTTLAGLAGNAGSADGVGSAARFRDPRGIAADGAGNVYVADTSNHTIRRVVAATGQVTTLAGLAGSPGGADGSGDLVRFSDPWGLAWGAGGNLYVADRFNFAIRKVAVGTGQVTTLAGLTGVSGAADGTGSAARFNNPTGLAIDGAGSIYVADFGNHTIRKVVSATGQTSTVAGLAGSPGTEDGAGSAARFRHPHSAAVDLAGNVYVSDWGHHTIRKVVAATGQVTTLVGLPAEAEGGPGSTDGTGSAARFHSVRGMALDGSGNLFVADGANHTIRKVVVATAQVTTLAGLAQSTGSADGIGSAAQFDNPRSVALDGTGCAYVADYNNHTIRKVNLATSEVTTVAGLPGSPGLANGVGSAARFQGPSGVVADGRGAVYVADSHNHAIRKLVLASGLVTTLAGGSYGSADGIGTAARFAYPTGVTGDRAGNLYVADSNNCTVRKVNVSTGQVTTLAGLALNCGSVDGTGSTARFYWNLRDVAADGAGNVFVADTWNQTIRKIAVATGQVTTIAGMAQTHGSADGVGSMARFSDPTGVAVDGSGHVYVADSGNGAIRRLAVATGEVTTPSRSEDRFLVPFGLEVGFSGELYVADAGDAAVRLGWSTLADVATIDRAVGVIGQARILGTAPQTATTWLWSQERIPAGSSSTLSSTSLRNPTFTPDVPGYYIFRLRASNGSQTSITSVDLASVVPGTPTASVSGGGAICPGQSATIEAALTGTPPWIVTWSDGQTQSGLTTSPASRQVSPPTMTVYTVTAMFDASGPGVSGGSATVTVGPAMPVVVVPAQVGAQSPNLEASVADHTGSTYAWTITNGTITSGQGTSRIKFTSGTEGVLTLGVVETDAGGCTSVQGTATVTVLDAVSAIRFYTLVPCRLLDTRDPNGPYGGPGLQPGQTRSFATGTICSIPAGARALSMNVTVTGPAQPGYLTLFAADQAQPLASTLNFKAVQTRANNALVRLSQDGTGSFSVFNGSGGVSHVIVDVNGYYQ